MKAPRRHEVTQGVLLRTYGVVFLVVLALLVGLTVAIYNKTFVDVVHVTLKTDRVGNQLAPPADVKLRGMIVGEVRSVSSDGKRATVDLALQPRTVGLIPANVTARLLPKTLFGEKFVDLQIPPRPSQARLSEGDVITQDRTSTAIELERVLDNLLPLLRTINPGKLNATLNALATALEGRGKRLGENLELVDGYFTRLNPELPTIQQDLVRARRRLGDLRRRRPRPGPRCCATSRSPQPPSRTSPRSMPASSPAPRASPTTTRQLLEEDGDRIIQLAAVSRPTLGLLARYSPEYPCLLQGLAQSDDLIGKTFANGELHITLEVTRARKGYQPGEEPAWREHRGPDCYGAAEPAPAVARQPLPGRHERRRERERDPPVPAGPAERHERSREEQGVVDALVAPADGRAGRRRPRRRDPALRADGPRDGGEPVVKTTSSLIKLIVFIVVTVLATGVLAATIGNFRFGGSTAYRALFTDATGLLKGDDVRIAGVRVGEIDGVSVTRHGDRSLALVSFSVQSDRPLADSTLAQIRYRNLVGQRYVALSEGAGSGERLGADGDDPAPSDAAGARPDRAVQRVQAAVRGAEPRGRQRLRDRDHQDAAGRGRHHQLAARPHRVADVDAGRPGRGHRPHHRQPQPGARHRRRAGQAARHADRRAAAVRHRAGRGPRGDRRVADQHREPGRRDVAAASSRAVPRSAATCNSSARSPAPSTTTRRSSTGS